MNKYIKLEDAIDCECPFNEIWEDCVGCPLNNSGIKPCKMGKWLNSLPTIDIVSCEECAWKNDCSQVVPNLERTVDTVLR